MKGLAVGDLRGSQLPELESSLAKLRQDMFGHRMKQSTNQLENTMLVRKTRRDIARVMTVITEKKKGGAGVEAAAAGGQTDSGEKE